MGAPPQKKLHENSEISPIEPICSQILVGVLKAVLTSYMAFFGFVWQPIPADVQHPRPYGSPPESCVAGHNMAFRIVRPMGPPPQAVVERLQVEEMRIFVQTSILCINPFQEGMKTFFSRNVCK